VSVAPHEPGVRTSRALSARVANPAGHALFKHDGAVAAGAAVLIFVALLARLPDPVSGADGGNWLALSQEFVGVHANAASTSYPPGFHLALLAMQVTLSPLESLRVLGAAVSVLPGLACYWLLRGLGCGRLAFLGLFASLTGFSLEMLAWGGYPQLMGSGLASGAVAALIAGFKSGAKTPLVIAGGLAGLTVLTHHLAAVQALVCLGTMSSVVVAAAGAARWVRIKQVLVTLAVACAIAMPAAPIYISLVTRAGPSAFNANGFDLGGIAQYLTNEAPVLWFAMGGFVPMAIAIRTHERAWTDVATLLGLLVASVGLTALTSELRFAYWSQALAIASAGIVFSRLIGRGAGAWGFALTTTVCALFVAVAATGVERLDRSVRFYAVLDDSLVEGLGWLDRNHHSGDLAVVTPGLEKWPLGWWVQGLGHVPSYLDYDPRWLYFQEEKEGSRIARAVLDEADPQAAAAVARTFGVTLIVIDAREVSQADVWLRSGRVSGDLGLVYANPGLAIFRVARST
jgi:hypothetical protein